MKAIKKILRTPAVILVTLYTKLLYNMGVEAAERRSRQERKMIFLTEDTFRPNRLVTYDREQFKAHKRAFGVSARLITMNTLRAGCYYHTADGFGRNAMDEREKTIRKKAFIKERLILAGLVNSMKA